MDEFETDDLGSSEEQGNKAQVFRAHDALDDCRRILKECFLNTTDEDHESCYQEALNNISQAREDLPERPRKKETVEQRRQRKEAEAKRW